MGIETAMMIGALASAASSVKSLTTKSPKATVPEPEKPPQATKAPSREPMLAANTMAASPAGAMSGNSGTFLTGPSGVDPSSLNLGRNTLLGQ